MKFSHIKIGERFIWEGEPYVKATPLLANHAQTGVNKMVPKYVNVEFSETRTEDAITCSKPDEMLEYIVSELSDAINSSTLSEAAKDLVKNEIRRIEQEAMKKIK
ncbi:MAG: hypothetical protein DIZ80_09400 [endosymbiont of Galathealinum brachiosum]|uniref:Uncharacterized protein n=1 Tax=endosymbiont of Galathealinum brachiosum TaxID=2200906 RepID=A0A370DC57_9GAMM|nr:MAG: hypothetical protein DIZ80_09400 [endosymbiont of Galathealinum brachiosum]